MIQPMLNDLVEQVDACLTKAFFSATLKKNPQPSRLELMKQYVVHADEQIEDMLVSDTTSFRQPTFGKPSVSQPQ